MGWKKLILGEKMPDKNDPKYAERYEKEVSAGRKWAKFLKIDKRRICAMLRLQIPQSVPHAGIRHRHRMPDAEYLPHGTDIQPSENRADGHGDTTSGGAVETET